MGMKNLISALALLVLVSGCATELTPLQRRAIESRDLEGKFDDAFKSTLQVFQDHGYTVKSTDYQSGVIQGATGFKPEFIYMVNHEITATLEQFGENRVKERLSLVRIAKMDDQQNSKPVDDPELFQQMYDEIQKEMFVRRNLSK